MRKTCSKCQQEKDQSCFSAHRKTADGLQSWCKECKKQLMRLKRGEPKYLSSGINVIKFIRDDKAAKGCCNCPENDPICLDHHHLRDKLFGLGGGSHVKRTLEEIKAEIAKCAVLCANCHRKLHGKRFTL